MMNLIIHLGISFYINYFLPIRSNLLIGRLLGNVALTKYEFVRQLSCSSRVVFPGDVLSLSRLFIRSLSCQYNDVLLNIYKVCFANWKFYSTHFNSLFI